MVQIQQIDEEAISTMDAAQLKAEGNEHFKAGDYDEALTSYTKALSVSDEKKASSDDCSALYKNKAACYLKLDKPQNAASEASKALEINPNDVKALYRRCQALEILDKKEEAYKDGMKLIKLDPKNKAVVPILHRLSAYVIEKNKRVNSTEGKVKDMFDIVFSTDSATADKNKRQQAMSNILVLAREEAGAQKIFETGGIEKLNTMLDNQDKDLRLNAIRALSSITKHSKLRTYAVFGKIGLVRILAQFTAQEADLCNATSSIVQSMLNGITNLEKFREDKAKHEAYKEKMGTPHGSKFKPLKLEEDEIEHVDQIFNALVKCINSHKLSAHGRDCVLELIIRNITSDQGLAWTRKFLETDGSMRLMEVAGMIPGRSTIAVTVNTRMHCSVLMQRVYDDTLSDQQRESIRAVTDEYFVEQFADTSFESKLDAVVALSCLLQGPTEVGNSVLAKAGVVDMLLALAESKEIDHQLIAVEALVHATSKKEKCKGIVNTAIPILKKLFKDSPSDNIKVRSLVGMCKISSSSGLDASEKSLSDESMLALSRACRKFLANEAKDLDLRKWAVEGLAYLTLDAEIKEELTNDLESIKALIEVAKIGDQTVLFPAASIFVNLMNAYEKPEIMPEMLKLAEYAKQKVPEEHPKDKEEFITKRVNTLVTYDVGSAAVALCKNSADSERCKELLSRVFLAISSDEKHRGKLVQQGGGKVLIPLALENTKEGKGLASQALAKLSITINPEVAFPGQRVVEVVRPLLSLLHPERTALQNFEALMGLTNLTSVSASARKRVVMEKGVTDIENYMLEEHEMLKRAATECICNLVLSEEVAELYFSDNDKAKLLTLFCGDEDPAVQRAACGALAILSSNNPEKITEKIINVKGWKELLLQVLVSEEQGVQHRASHLVAAMVETSKDVAEQVVDSQLFEVLLAITKLEGEEHKGSVECAQHALECSAKHGLVAPTDH